MSLLDELKKSPLLNWEKNGDYLDLSGFIEAMRQEKQMDNDKTIDLPDEPENGNMTKETFEEYQVRNIPPGIIEAIKKQVIAEMQDANALKAEEEKIRREKEKAERDKYIETMKASPDPWVEIMGETKTPEGMKIELEWNEPFVKELRDNGITGADDDQLVQKWIALLMHDLSTKMDENTDTSYE